MKVSDIIYNMDENTSVDIIDIVTDEILEYYDGKNSLTNKYNEYDVQKFSIDRSTCSLMVYINKYVYFDDLMAEAKISCIVDYLYTICPYEHFDNVKTLTEMENIVKEFWRNSEWQIDKHGHWYDEDDNMLS